MSNIVGQNAEHAKFGFTDTLSTGYIQDLSYKTAAEKEEVVDKDGNTVLVAFHGGDVHEVSFSFIPYSASPTFDHDDVGSGTEIVCPELAKKIYVTEVETSWEAKGFKKYSCSGVIYDSINTSSTVTTTTTT